ncbi:MAG: hypothetical protein ABEH64_00505 [Salinirussus sp.]
MFGKLGPVGIFGLLCLLAGVVVIAWQNLLIAGGLALVIAGLGFVVYGLISQLKASLGLGGGLV